MIIVKTIPDSMNTTCIQEEVSPTLQSRSGHMRYKGQSCTQCNLNTTSHVLRRKQDTMTKRTGERENPE